MAVCVPSPSSRSQLNPNAPFFVPSSFLATEDFSPEWWHLVQTCPAFREYWLSERFDPEQQHLDSADLASSLLFADPDLFLEAEDELLLQDFDLVTSFTPSKEENTPPVNGFLPSDLKDLMMSSGVSEPSLSPKQNRKKFSSQPASVQEKPPRVVAGSFPKPCTRKIQQPR